MVEWRVIPEFPHYEVSDCGDVRRCAKGPTKRGKVGQVMKSSCGAYGYLLINLMSNRQHRCRGVHTLVLRAFVGPPPTPKHQGAHGDGVRTNNCLSNLRWATSKENHRDRVKHGTHPSGAKNANATLTEADAAEIRRIYTENLGEVYVRRGTRRRLAQHYGVCVSAIGRVVSGVRWNPHRSSDEAPL